MSSTETQPHTTDGWGIDWRSMRIWVTLLVVSLQLALIAAMTVLISAGFTAYVLADWNLDWYRALSMAGPLALSMFLFHGWVFLPDKQSGDEGEDRSAIYQAGSKTDKIIFWCWSSGLIFMVFTLSLALLELFELDGWLGHALTGLSVSAPAFLLGIHGFPYVLDRLRKTANIRRPA